MKSWNWLFQDLDFPGILKKYNVEFPGVKQEITKNSRGNKEKITKNLASFPIGAIWFCRIFLWMNSFVLSRTSKGEITNLENPVAFSKRYVLNCHLFSGIAQFKDKKPISDENFFSVQSWTTLFLHLLFVMTFSYTHFPSFHTKNLWCYAWAIYILVR